MTDDERPEDQPAEDQPPADEAPQTPAPPDEPPQTPAPPDESEPQATEPQPTEAAEPPDEPEASPADEEQPEEAAAPPAAAEPEAEKAAEAAPADEGEGEKPEAAPEPPAAAPGESRAKPEIPGADLEVDIVPEGSDPLAQAEAAAAELAESGEALAEPDVAAEAGEEAPPPAQDARPQAAIDLGADARYKATGKRKTAIARVVLKPGSGAYAVNGHPLEEYFPRSTAQRNIREPLETVGYDGRMDVVASLHGGGVSAQAGALRHGIARALLEADPNLRIELKRRGFLTRDARVKERRKAGLKKARKRPQFSKR